MMRVWENVKSSDGHRFWGNCTCQVLWGGSKSRSLQVRTPGWTHSDCLSNKDQSAHTELTQEHRADVTHAHRWETAMTANSIFGKTKINNQNSHTQKEPSLIPVIQGNMQNCEN